MEGGGDWLFGVAVMALVLVIYMLPGLIAEARGRDGVFLIAVLNLFLGWTVIGWLVLLVIAFTGESGKARKQREEELVLLRKLAHSKASE